MTHGVASSWILLVGASMPGLALALPDPPQSRASVRQAGPLSSQASSSCPSWRPTFRGLPGTIGSVLAMGVFDDGTGPALYVVGGFSNVSGQLANGVARWDGSSWSVPGMVVIPSTGVPNVSCMTVFDDGSGPALYVGGAFTSMGGVPANFVARWNGSSWTALGTGPSGTVSALAVFDDGGGPALYAGGQFNAAGGVAAKNIARWDGSSWSALGSGLSSKVVALTSFDDGSGPALFAGGEFTSAGGAPASRIARWDGASWSALGSGMTGSGTPSVNAFTVLDDGSGPTLVAGGEFTDAGGVPANRIARWDGASWAAVGAGVSSTVQALAVLDGAGPAVLYAGGFFKFAEGREVSQIARWTGSSWIGVGGGTNGAVRALVVFDDGSGAALHAGGGFSKAGDAFASRVARWAGESWSELGCGRTWLNGRVGAMTVFDDGGGPELVVGGTFSSAGGVPANSIASWDGTSWSALGTGLELPPNETPHDNVVGALAVYDDGNGPALYAGGDFQTAGGVPAFNVARWDGASWSALGSGVNGIVFALRAFDDGNGPALYAGGIIFGASGAVGIARWDGSSWSTPGGSMNSFVRALEVFDDGSGPALYAGGEFTSAGGVPANRIARWDGATWSALGSGLNLGVYSMTVFDGGIGLHLYVGGNFTTAGGTAATRIARWNGTAWSSLGSVIGTVSFEIPHCLAGFDDGNGLALYAGGSFSSAGGVAANYIARWDGDIAGWSPLQSGMTTTVYCLGVFDDGSGASLYAGTTGASIDSGDPFLARWGCDDGFDTTPPAIHCPPGVTVLDRLGSPFGEVVTFNVRACDDLDPTPVVTCVPPSGSVFAPGTTLVICTVTDAAGNTASCDFPVTVERKARPR